MNNLNNNKVTQPEKIDENLPTLVSFSICPFVQRSVITLNQKNVKFDRIYIDLACLPEWFTNIVPTGKVPALLLNNEVLFESAVINEYIDEAYLPRLQEKTLWERARDRAWICYVEELLFDQFRLLMANTEEAYQEEKMKFISKLETIAETAGNHYFNNDTFGLLDAAIAPVFTRIHLTPGLFDEIKSTIGNDSNLISWMDNIIGMTAVKNSVADDFDEQFIEYFKQANSYIVQSTDNPVAA